MVRHVLLAAYCGLSLIAVALPGPLGIGQRLEPRWLGLPPALTWTMFWVMLSFLAMLAYYLTGRKS